MTNTADAQNFISKNPTPMIRGYALFVEERRLSSLVL